MPQKHGVLIGFVLGERAVKAALDAAIPSVAKEIIEAAARYGEGRGVRMTMSVPADVITVLAITAATVVH